MSSQRKTLKLRLDPAGKGTVSIDDFDISNHVTAVKLETNVGEANRVTIEFVAVNLDVEGELRCRR